MRESYREKMEEKGVSVCHTGVKYHGLPYLRVCQTHSLHDNRELAQDVVYIE